MYHETKIDSDNYYDQIKIRFLLRKNKKNFTNQTTQLDNKVL